MLPTFQSWTPKNWTQLGCSGDNEGFLLYPNRHFDNLSNLFELIEQVLENLSAGNVRQSVSKQNDFPNAATFQHVFMEGLNKFTNPNVSGCPEISYVFGSDENILGSIDFFWMEHLVGILNCWLMVID